MRNRTRVNSLLMITMVVFVTSTRANQGPYGLKQPPKKDTQPQVEFIAPEELIAKLAKNDPVSIVDLRGPSVYARADKTIVGAVHSKVRRVVYRLREFPREREVVTYCACPGDEAAIIGARALLENGFKQVRVLKGGWSAWVQAGGPLRPRPR
jgi:rhodanese-related sulfurtransferase